MSGSADNPAQTSVDLAFQQNMLQQQNLQAQQMWMAPVIQPSSSMSYTITTTGDEYNALYSRECEVSRIIKRTKDGYFFIITVDATDDVFYRVWRGGMFPYVIAKMFKKFAPDIKGNRDSWNLIPKRTHLPATLGAAYEKIEEAIKEDIENMDHEQYVKDMLKTSPENLKMIGGLERLAEGDADAPKADPNAGSSHSVGATYSNNISVSGSGTAITNQTGNALAGQPGGLISFTPTVPNNDITGVETMEAEKIILNGTDLATSIDEKIREATTATEALGEKLDAMIEDNKELAKAP